MSPALVAIAALLAAAALLLGVPTAACAASLAAGYAGGAR